MLFKFKFILVNSSDMEHIIIKFLSLILLLKLIYNNNNNLLPRGSWRLLLLLCFFIVYKTWSNFNFHVLEFKRFGISKIKIGLAYIMFLN